MIDLTALLTSQVLGFALVFARIGAAMVFMPGFGEALIPARHRLVAAFVISLGATINMNGTAMYLGLATIFGAQAFGVDLTWNDYFLISILGTLGAIGAAGIPGAGLIMMVLVFGAVGVPLETIALVAGIDRIMDMMRTTTNVSGDAAVAVTVASMTGELDRAEMISADDV